MWVFVLRVRERRVSSAGLIVVLPVRPNNRRSLYLCGWMGNMGLQHLCAKARAQRSTQHTCLWLKIDTQHKVSEAAGH